MARSGQAKMRLLGHTGAGEGPPWIKIPGYTETLRGVVAARAETFQSKCDEQAKLSGLIREYRRNYWPSLQRERGNRVFHCPKRGATGILQRQDPGDQVEFFAFDKGYVDRLRDGDPTTEHHFVSYFEQLLRIKLRARRLASDVVDDLRQKTFVRVIEKVRKDEVRQPERFGAFVNSTCNNVLLEYYRDVHKSPQMDESQLETTDKVLDLEGMLVTKQSGERVRQILAEMPEKDRLLLRAIFLEEKDKDEVCQELRVERDYLRVLVHRAKDKFRALYEKDRMGGARRVGGAGV